MVLIGEILPMRILPHAVTYWFIRIIMPFGICYYTHNDNDLLVKRLMFNGFITIISDGMEYIFNSSTQCYIFDNIETQNLYWFSKPIVDYELPPTTLDFDFDISVNHIALYLIKPNSHIVVKFICLCTYYFGISKKNYTTESLSFLKNNARFETLRIRVARIEENNKDERIRISRIEDENETDRIRISRIEEESAERKHREKNKIIFV